MPPGATTVRTCRIAVLDDTQRVEQGSVPAEKAGRVIRQVDGPARRQPREPLRSALIHRDGPSEPFESVTAEVRDAHRIVEQVSGGNTHEHLAGVGQGGEARGPVNDLTDIPAVNLLRLPRVDPDTHVDKPFGQGRVHVGGGEDGAVGCWENGEERVSAGVDLGPAMRRQDGPHRNAMLRQYAPVLHRPEVAQQPRRPDDVGEHQGDGPRRQLTHHNYCAPTSAEPVRTGVAPCFVHLLL